MALPITGATEMTVSQSSKYATSNTLDRVTEAAGCGTVNINFATDADYTLTTTGEPAQWHYHVIVMTDTGTLLTTGRSVNVPDQAKPYVFCNTTSFPLTMTTTGGTGITVAANNSAMVRSDGTNVVRVTADSPAT